MSRSNYAEGFGSQEECWSYVCWRGAVESSIRGKRGQAFLKELVAGLDAMEVKELIANNLEADGQFCALGVVGAARGIDLSKIDPEDWDRITQELGISNALAREIAFVNDEYGYYDCTPEKRWRVVRDWAAKNIKAAKP